MAGVNKEKSAARLASLQKCAAADRSAARLGALRKCAGIVSDYALDKIPMYEAKALQRRRRDVTDASDNAGAHGTANAIAEALGRVTSGAVGAAAGGTIGHLLTKDRGADAHLLGTVGGGVAGVAVPAIIGALVAAIRRRRTKEEQIRADSAGRAAAKYVIPGLAGYDSFKRLGASEHYRYNKIK